MKAFAGKVAVVTGAASGIGRALADRCVQEQMKVVLADIDESALTRASEELLAMGATVLAVRTDVSQEHDVRALAEKTIRAYGAVHILFNNAGVGIIGPAAWEYSLSDWEWILGVNLWGVVHGVRVFVPIMLEQGTECHVVNTASIAGLATYACHGPYAVAKHGVVSLSEMLSEELAQRGARIGVSVLCPGRVNTRIIESSIRNRPATTEATVGSDRLDPQIAQLLRDAMPAQQVADDVFTAIRHEQLYIFTHKDSKQLIERRMGRILKDCPAA